METSQPCVQTESHCCPVLEMETSPTMCANLEPSTIFIAAACASFSPQELFQVAQDLIHVSEDSEQHTASRMQSGWSLLSAYISMGPTYVRALVPALLGLWKNFFPHSMKQLKEELSKESLSSLTFLLEQRTGVLSGTTAPQD